LFRVALRQSWIGVVAVSAIGIAAGSVQASAFVTVAGKTAAAQAAFGAQMVALARQIAYLLPIPVHPETVAGYVQWRVFGGMAIVLLIPSTIALFALGLTAGFGAAPTDWPRPHDCVAEPCAVLA